MVLPMQSDAADLGIVGGGAAGLAAAIFAAGGGGGAPGGGAGEAAEAAQGGQSGFRIVVLDGAKTLGAKILVSGGGRCNVTHHEVLSTDFNGSQTVVRNILSAFDVPATIRWFASLGVELKREPTGKLFPVADSARVVLKALLDRCDTLKVTLLTNHKVTGILPPSEADGWFQIQHT